MAQDPQLTERLRSLLLQLQELTNKGQLHWERQLGSAHRYARWKENLLILGPSHAASDVPRYLFITPFDSPAHLEVNTDDAELGDEVRKLSADVEKASSAEPPTDPFALTDEVLGRLT